MIFNFNKFVSINEGYNNNFNVGDYVFLYDEDAFELDNGEIVPPWQDSYGQIIKNSFNKDNVYLVKLFSEITEEIAEIIVDQKSYQMRHFYKYPGKDTICVNNGYLIKYNSKEEFDKAVEKIEMEKNTGKYNL